MRVASAAVTTRPPTINGSHISAPVRATCDDDALLEELELCELWELWDDCALAAPANVNVMTNARNAPASSRRTIDPVVRT